MNFKIYCRSIWLYPNGDIDESYIALFLLADEKGSSKWKVNYEIGIKGLKESELVYDTKHADEFFSALGQSHFLSHEQFFDPTAGFFKDGKFAVFCKVNNLSICKESFNTKNLLDFSDANRI
jgi:hypothetical protein